MYDEIEIVKAKEKQMKVLRNGNSSQLITVKLTSNIKFNDLQRALEEKIDFRNCKKLRLFTEKGVEIYQDDLEFLKDGTHLYASKGKKNKKRDVNNKKNNIFMFSLISRYRRKQYFKRRIVICIINCENSHHNCFPCV